MPPSWIMKLGVQASTWRDAIRAEGAVRVVGLEADVVGLGHCGDLFEFEDATGLDDDRAWIIFTICTREEIGVVPLGEVSKNSPVARGMLTCSATRARASRFCQRWDGLFIDERSVWLHGVADADGVGGC